MFKMKYNYKILTEVWFDDTVTYSSVQNITPGTNLLFTAWALKLLYQIRHQEHKI
jgi:hypothetical protein